MQEEREKTLKYGSQKASLTSGLNAKVDLAFRGMGDGVATELHITADGNRKMKATSEINVLIKMGGDVLVLENFSISTDPCRRLQTKKENTGKGMGLSPSVQLEYKY